MTCCIFCYCEYAHKKYQITIDSVDSNHIGKGKLRWTNVDVYKGDLDEMV